MQFATEKSATEKQKKRHLEFVIIGSFVIFIYGILFANWLSLFLIFKAKEIQTSLAP